MHMVLWNVWVNGDDKDGCWGDMDDNGDVWVNGDDKDKCWGDMDANGEGDKDDGDMDGDGKWKISTILAKLLPNRE